MGKSLRQKMRQRCITKKKGVPKGARSKETF